MRRLAAALLATTLLLAACGGADEPSDDETPTDQTSEPTGSPTDEPSADDVAALEAVQVEGEPGSEPTLTFEQPFDVSAPVGVVETEGTGEDLVDGQIIRIHYVAVNGDDGSVLGSTWEGDPDQLTVGDPQILPALTNALAGQKVGARVLFAAPRVPSQQEDVPDTPATIMAIDVMDARTIPDSAEGTAVDPVEGLPTVTFEEGATSPTIDVEGVAAPTELVVQPLIEGEGPEVEVGQTLTINYHGVLLADGETFDSSWERGTPATFPIGVGNLIQGWDEGLPGQKVGSRVLLVIPAAQAYGDTERPGIPANSDLVFVVDILDAG